VADYVKSTNFAVKDSLTTGNPAKVVKGTEIDVEFNNIASAISSKLDATSPTLSGNFTVTGSVTANSLVVGSQASKATINYSTNAARTLTVPAVAGNSTFAFLEEAQTFTANQTVAANLVLSGNARRLQGNFDTATLNNRTLLQTSTTNGTTSVGAIPNGTAQGCSFIVNNNSNPTNATFTAIYVDDDECSLNGSIWGSGSYLPLRIFNGGGVRILIDPTGEVAINAATDVNTSLNVNANGRTYSLSADGRVKFANSYGNTVGATNRTLYIDSTGDIGGLSSTRESKANITPIADTNWIMSLEPVSYNRRKKDSKGNYTEEVNPNTEFGLIADDVANIRPELCVFVDGKVSGINYEQLISPMLKEIQKLRAEVEALKEKVNG
jgi:hypothetical protein